MKQKVVLRLQMSDERARRKALKIVVVQYGVLSAQIAGKEKDQLEVVGEEVDSVTMAIAPRKKMGLVDIVSVASVDQKKDGQTEEKKPDIIAVPWSNFPTHSHYIYGQAPPYNGYVYVDDDRKHDTCSVM